LYFSRFFSLPLSLSLSHFATSIPHVLDFLSLLIAYFARCFSSPSIQYLFSLSSFPHLNFAISFLSFILSLPRYSFVIHHPYPCCILDSLILSLLSCLSVSLSLSLSSTFIHLPFALNPSSLAYPFLWWYFSLSLLLRVFFSFLSSIPLVSCTLPFFHFSSNFARSLSHFHSHPIPPALFPPLPTPSTPLKYFSCTLFTSSCSVHPQISALYISIVFLFFPAFRQYPALFPSIYFVLKLCRSLSRFYSHPIPLALSLPLLVPSTPRSLPHTSIYSLSGSQTSSFSS
jgi:hypothetical protein